MDLIQQNQIYRLPLLTLFGNGAKGCALLWPGRMFGISAEETDLKKLTNISVGPITFPTLPTEKKRVQGQSCIMTSRE